MDVLFRKFEDGDVVALFPTETWAPDVTNTITSYQHVGQHGGASIRLLYTLEPATPEEYAPLLRELESIGYDNLEVF